MKLGIFGSRSLTELEDYNRIKEKILKRIDDIEFLIVPAEIKGACEQARLIAKELKISILLVYPNFDKYSSGAYEKRSKMIVELGDYFLAFHDGQSVGTLNDLRLVRRARKKFEYILLRESKRNPKELLENLDLELENIDILIDEI